MYGNGNVGNNGATYSYCVRPALSVASATIVSDEGADGIYLAPVAPIKEVEAVCFCGNMENRPSAARVVVDAVNLYDVSVKVSNNVKDAEPAWVDATGGSEVALTNTAKTSEKWEIGVKLYGKSATIGYFSEPVVICKE